MAGNKKDVRKELTERVIEMLENNEAPPWRRRWDKVMVRPFNPYSGTRFTGGNVLNLLLSQSVKGSIDPRWMTFDQINKAGFKLTKGSKATPVEYWGFINKSRDNVKGLDAPNLKHSEDDEEDEKIFFAKYYSEFNGEDIEGLPELYYERPDFEPHELLERLIKATGVNYQHRTVTATDVGFKTDAAFYSFDADVLVMPPKGAFASDDAYYKTFLHELCHWSGHADRLARREHGVQVQPDSSEYAMEELRAEMGACILSSMFGLKADLDSHAAYTTHYLNLMKDEKGGKHVLFKAAKAAEEIIDYLLEFDPELRQMLEGEIIEANYLFNANENKLEADAAPKPLDIPDFAPKAHEEALPEANSAPEVISAEQAWDRFCQTSHSRCMDAALNDKYFNQIKIREEGMFKAHLDTLDQVTTAEIDNYATRIVQGWERSSEIHGYWNAFCKQMREMWDTDEPKLGADANSGRKAFLDAVLTHRSNFARVAEIVKRDEDFQRHQQEINSLLTRSFMSDQKPVLNVAAYTAVVEGCLPPELLQLWKSISEHDQTISPLSTATELPASRYEVDDAQDDIPYVSSAVPSVGEVVDELNGALPVFDEVKPIQEQRLDVDLDRDDDAIRPLGNALELTSESSQSF
ncbi:ArdC family protein [Serratia symbiotica]|uniref:ArdC family protein n=1 Tax=Serratia symbiotica TaxID=138074 RepID=UPI00132AB607|nr:zincin-like metallopeptidase domain-containing protein [Serratia symbiotica]QTP13370.1 DUF1738 domain-containing protein [Serratia symbiotica]